MKILHRLYLSEFFKLLGIITIGIAFIFSLIDLIEKIDDFAGSRFDIGSVLLYAFLIMPKFLLYLLPMAVLICSLFVLSQASRRREITVIKASGGRIRRLFRPFIITGVFISIFAFIIGEFVAPSFSEKATKIKNRLEGRSKKTAFSGGAVWLKNREGNPVRIELYLPEKKMAQGVRIFVPGGDFLDETITAGKAFWDGEKWMLEDVTIHNVSSGKVQTIQSMNYQKLDSPDIFSDEMKTTDEMGISELYNYNRKLRESGYSNIKLSVDFYSKLSFPLVNIFMIFLGTALSARAFTGGGLFTAGLGLLISLSYWLFYTLSLSAGYAGILPPFLSVSLTPAAFGAIAVYNFVKIPE